MTSSPILHDAFLLGLAWLGYFVVHSLLASLSIKQWVSDHYPGFMPAYRLSFNFVAVALLSVPFYISYTGQSIALWQFSGPLKWLMTCIAISALIGFVLSLRYYDSQEFLGLRQLREHETRVEDQENLQLSPFHRYVRHPWYTFALMIIWSRPMDSLVLMSSVLITAYFIVGSRLEERKLLHYYGEVYQTYRSRVPGLIPLPWRNLKPADADALLQKYRDNSKLVND